MSFSIDHRIFSHITLSPDFYSKNQISFMSRKCDELYLGFIIPRKLGSAVSRNKFKKRCRHAISTIQKSGKLPTVGVVVRPKHINFNFNTINDSIESWVKSLGVN
ncbi:MAG: hypothetical protein CMG05_02450 [Candidatus Marinimicrobia bacterium]|nr:hypothetical protein [Candidatus Neomarinimicrobiota bacterium]|tara:strand:+ start:30406 stop:30720 length:315 start_codon:yes stop_codon:yes gene_type:complete